MSNQQNVLRNDEANNNQKLFDVHYSDGSYAASFHWLGEKLMQPAITTNNPDTKYLSYDGEVNFIEGYNETIMPGNGELYEIKQDTFYYFSPSNPEIFKPMYALDRNNKSIRMNNISIMNSDCSKLVMLDFRASMEGKFEDSKLNGCIVVLASIDPIS
jgi:hypothetical protein